MSGLTPAERIDLKADMERARALGKIRSPFMLDSSLSSSNLKAEDRNVVDMALRRYPALVELVRRLTEEE